MGASNDKDIAGVVKELAPIFSLVIVTRAENPRSVSPEVLAAEFAKCGIDTIVTANIPQALERVRTLAAQYDLTCVTGSLFVAGEAIACLEQQDNPGHS
jgi:dihydrofolate synthase/folylpolyglutamate synthase